MGYYNIIILVAMTSSKVIILLVKSIHAALTTMAWCYINILFIDLLFSYIGWFGTCLKIEIFF